MSDHPITLHEAMIDLVQALLAPPGPDDVRLDIVSSSKMLMASLALHDRAIRLLGRQDIADALRMLATVVERVEPPITPATMGSLTRLITAVADAVKGGAA